MHFPQLEANPYKGRAVAVLGDVMVDRFIYGNVERISPEAPIPVVAVTKRTTHLGGGGNVACNLQALGAKPLLIGRIGNDELGRGFVEICEKAGMDASYLVKTALPTISKTRIIARTQQVVRFDEEKTDALTEADRNAILAQLQAVRKHTDVIIVSDYGKGMIDAGMLGAVRSIFGDGVILVDPKPRPSITYANVTTMTPNLSEAYKLAGLEKGDNTNAAVESLASQLVQTLGLNHVLITRSEAGMTLFHKNSQVVHVPTRAREVTDVSGAGDTVIAAYAAGLAAGLNPIDAAQLANVAAGIVVGKLGTATVTWAEMKAEMNLEAEREGDDQ